MSVPRMPRVDTFARLCLALLLVFCAVTAAEAQNCNVRPAPQINAPATICPAEEGTATIAQPETGNWTAVSWSISGGTITYQQGSLMHFTADGSGQVVLQVTATDETGCVRPVATATVELGEIPAPVINVPAETCPGASAYAS